MVSANAPAGLGISLNPFHYVKSAATSVYHAAQDPRVQQAAAAAAQAYAPNQYAQATMYADRARGIVQLPPGAVPGPPPPMPGGGAMVDDGGADEGAAVVHPNVIQKNNFMPYIVIGGGALVLLLLLKR